VKVFREAEKVGTKSNMALFYYIYKGIIGLNSQELIEYLLSDNMFMDTFGILECNNLQSFCR
jgi:hypothetical protein